VLHRTHVPVTGDGPCGAGAALRPEGENCRAGDYARTAQVKAEEISATIDYINSEMKRLHPYCLPELPIKTRLADYRGPGHPAAKSRPDTACQAAGQTLTVSSIVSRRTGRVFEDLVFAAIGML
jgi:hypothetical protein